MMGYSLALKETGNYGNKFCEMVARSTLLHNEIQNSSLDMYLRIIDPYKFGDVKVAFFDIS